MRSKKIFKKKITKRSKRSKRRQDRHKSYFYSLHKTIREYQKGGRSEEIIAKLKTAQERLNFL